MNFATVIASILICIFLYFQREALWFQFIFYGTSLGYDPKLVMDVRSAMVLFILIGFIMRNEVDNFRHHK